MFERIRIRGWIAAVWLIAFGVLMMLFQYAFLPHDAMIKEINNLEKSIAGENWTQAASRMDNIERIWLKHKFAVHVINEDRDIAHFEGVLGRVKTLINYKDDDAIEYTGELKTAADSIMKAFLGS